MPFRNLDPSNDAWTMDVIKLCLSGPSIPENLLADNGGTGMPDVHLDVLCATIFFGFDMKSGQVASTADKANDPPAG